jgi:hypothetical protein
VRSAYRVQVYLAAYDSPLRVRQYRRSIPARLLRFPIRLYDLPVAGTHAESVFNAGRVRSPSVRGNLRMMPYLENLPVDDAPCKIVDESRGRFAVSLAEREARNQFRVFVQGDEKVLIADGRIALFLRAQTSLLLLYECPDFIALDMVQEQVLHPFVQKLSHLLAHMHHEFHYRGAMDVG